MGKPSRASQQKRSRERSQIERQLEKLEQRALRKEEKEARIASLEDGIDPDLIGISPGPQPIPADQ